jgi:hypothetical protein
MPATIPRSAPPRNDEAKGDLKASALVQAIATTTPAVQAM